MGLCGTGDGRLFWPTRGLWVQRPPGAISHLLAFGLSGIYLSNVSSPSYFLSLIALVAPPSLLLSAETCLISTSLTAYSTLACSFCSQGPVRWPQGIGLR